MQLAQRFRLPLLVAGLLGALYLLLIQERVALPNRAAMALWNLAHLPLFFALTLIFDNAVLKRRPRQVSVWLQLLLPPLLIFAFGTEWLQSLTDRQPSWLDVLTNCAGIALGTIWLLSRHHASPRSGRGLRALVLLVGLVMLVQPLRLFYADYHSQRHFPLLSDFESFIDSANWSLGERSNEQVRAGEYALRVKLPALRFAGTTLRHFPGDWSAYQNLHLAVFNPGTAPLPLSLRVHDQQHELADQPYHDRFNYNFSAAPGWTDISLPLSRIASGPRHRKLDLQQVAALRVFYQGNPATETVIYLDSAYLD